VRRGRKGFRLDAERASDPDRRRRRHWRGGGVGERARPRARRSDPSARRALNRRGGAVEACLRLGRIRLGRSGASDTVLCGVDPVHAGRRPRRFSSPASIIGPRSSTPGMKRTINRNVLVTRGSSRDACMAGQIGDGLCGQAAVCRKTSRIRVVGGARSKNVQATRRDPGPPPARDDPESHAGWPTVFAGQPSGVRLKQTE